ncbi:hypothetical protein Y1Q_0021714 [Alligator mississippiensis]|uniref:Uncharacterized protein n=1 Tax=Alligator mississippiensis TaxID=8496 RepID=A0A151PAL6_ALLMI|nr:hypothetical protein Y1Q_0021714 [Alligator mississippiensis]
MQRFRAPRVYLEVTRNYGRQCNGLLVHLRYFLLNILIGLQVTTKREALNSLYPIEINLAKSRRGRKHLNGRKQDQP